MLYRPDLKMARVDTSYLAACADDKATEEVEAREQLAIRVFQEVVKEMVANYGRPDVRWGDYHKLLRAGREYEMDGGLEPMMTIHQVGAEVNAKNHAVGYGSQFVMVLTLGEEMKAELMGLFGQSADPDSPHYSDKFELYQKRKFRPTYYHWEDVRANEESRAVISFGDTER